MNKDKIKPPKSSFWHLLIISNKKESKGKTTGQFD